VAHEYFHNWTGNRITCRDWFQLCLKEGLTVFRDQEFSSDERSRPVERIANVQTLRAAQFVEDAGPLAHPVRPQQYKEINNFYTATVYNKGSEVIQMLRLIIGSAKFREGMDLYFARHDGEACTVEQFIRCFADVSGQDFTQFMRWYDQAGTPTLSVHDRYDAGTKRYELHFKQETKPTPGQPEKLAQVIPVKLGLIDEAGAELLSDDVVIVDRDTVTKVYENVPRRPIPSLLRGFSAPVRLDLSRRDGDLLALAAHDRDPFNRWQALQDVEIDLLRRSVTEIRAGRAPLSDPRLAEAIAGLISSSDTDPAFSALAIGLPRETEMAREIARDVDPEAIGAAVGALWREIGRHVDVVSQEVYQRLSKPVPFSPDAKSAGQRALALRLLNYRISADPTEGAALAFRQFERADNMTDRANALWALTWSDRPERDEALSLAEKRFADDPLLMDLWFTLNASIPGPEGLRRVEALMSHPKFTLANPNRARALAGAFAHGNPRGFHAADGAGYRVVAGVIGEIDGKNPQLAARLATAFRTWRGLETGRAKLAEAALRELSGRKALSRDLADILERSLA
jgi:aminopeptidase N